MYTLLLSILSLFYTTPHNSVTQHGLDSDKTVFGYWKTIDDETGTEKAVVKVYYEDGVVKGKVIQLLEGATMTHCTTCSGPSKNMPLEGMVFLDEFVYKNEIYTNGTIFDPKKGKIYRSKMFLVPDSNGDRLEVRGYWTVFFRSQVWERVK